MYYKYSLAFLILIFVLFAIRSIILHKNESLIFDDHIDHKLMFQRYLKKFNKSYLGLEYSRRFLNFKNSLKEIARLNIIEGDEVYGLTQFSDMSAKEFADQMLLKRNYRGPGDCLNRPQVNCSTFDMKTPIERSYGDTIPDKFDWREVDGVIGPIQDQRRCNGCWAFAIVGATESMAAIQKVRHEALSIQELLDCSTYNQGCSGGNVAIALDFMCRTKMTLRTEDEYPLSLSIKKNCQAHLVSGSGVKIKEFSTTCQMNEDDMLRAIVNHGPLIVIINAANWYYYVGKVIRRACGRNLYSADHVVQIVGYDKTAEIPHYIVKNSYGTLFGDNGYVKIAIGNNVCGVADAVFQIDVVKQ